MIKAGERFRVFNGDAKGTVKTANTQIVTYSFDHDLETTHEMATKHFDSITYPLVEVKK